MDSKRFYLITLTKEEKDFVIMLLKRFSGGLLADLYLQGPNTKDPILEKEHEIIKGLIEKLEKES